MLLIPLYHKVCSKGEPYSNTPDMMRKHLTYIKERFSTIFPWEKRDALSVCLSFDDATVDFYHYVFPLIQELQLKTLLAVAPKPIVERASLPMEKRLQLKSSFEEKSEAFCTWEELSIIAKEPLVDIASHSYSHLDLTKKMTDLDKEISYSKKLLELKLHREIKSFIYPYGKCNKRVCREVEKEYPYSFRIGSAINFGKGSLFYRVPADQLPSKNAPFLKRRYLFYTLKYVVNKMRAR